MPIFTTKSHLVTAMFEDLSAARKVVQDLRRRGIPDRDISLMSSADVYTEEDYRQIDQTYLVDEKSGAEGGMEVGAAVGGVGGFVVGLTTVTIPGIGPLLAIGNVLAATITGVAAGGLAGGLIGALVDLGVPEERARVYQEGVRRGHALVAVQSPTEDVSLIKETLAGHSPLELKDRIEV